jgi:uncharacterized SAM-binding protein YcdF (DUF218 family)
MEYVLQPLGLVWAASLAFAVRCLWHRRWPEAAWSAGVALFLWVVGGSPLSPWLLAELERPYVASTRTVGRADAVVMLGGTHSATANGWLPFNLAESGDRVLAALELVRLGKATNLVLGGSYYESGGGRRPDSELLVAWIQAWKLPTGKVHPLGICADTRVEAERTAELARRLGWRRVIVVSSACHLRRAEATFRKAGLDVEMVGCEFIGVDRMASRHHWTVVPRIEGFLLCNAWLHEQVGWLYYRLKGWA